MKKQRIPKKYKHIKIVSACEVPADYPVPPNCRVIEPCSTTNINASRKNKPLS